MEARILTTVESPWTDMQPVRIGSIPTGMGTPDVYVVVAADETPKMRVDAYLGSEEQSCFQEAIVWSDMLALGIGEHVYLVTKRRDIVCKLALGTYFCSFSAGEDYLLVASAERVYRLSPDGQLVWRSDEVAIDGVRIDEVEDGVIRGSGECASAEG